MTCPIEESIKQASRDLFQEHGPQDKVLAAETWKDMMTEFSKMQCTCCNLGDLCANKGVPPVTHSGSRKAEIMVIGEGPGMDERSEGECFVGRSGQLLRGILKDKAGIPESNVFFANVAKCRPYDILTDPKNPMEFKTKDCPPSSEQAAKCMPLLRKQLSLVKPRIIVFLGGVAATYCLGLKTSGLQITKLVGYGTMLKFRDFKALGLIATHTSYMLRNPSDTAVKRENVKLYQEIASAMESRSYPSYYQLKTTHFKTGLIPNCLEGEIRGPTSKRS